MSTATHTADDVVADSPDRNGGNFDPLNIDDSTLRAEADKLFDQYSIDAPSDAGDDDAPPPAPKPAKPPRAAKAPKTTERAPAKAPAKAAAKPAAPAKTSTPRDESPARNDAAATSPDASEEVSDFSPELVDMAKSAGMSDDDLALFDSERDLRRHLIMEDRRRLNQARAESQTQSEPSKKPTPPTKPAKTLAKSPEPQEEIDDEEPPVAPSEEGDISLDDWQDADDATKRLVKTVMQQQKELKELRELRQHVTQSQQTEQQAKTQRFASDFHAALNEIDPELFGTFDREAEQFVSPEEDQRRQQVFEAYRDMFQHFAKSGDPLTNIRANVQRLYGALFPKRVLEQNNQQWRNRLRTNGVRKVGGGGRRRASVAGMPRPVSEPVTEAQTEDLLTYDNPAIQDLFDRYQQ